MGSPVVRGIRVIWTQLTSKVSGLKCETTIISQPLLLQLADGVKAAIVAYQKSDGTNYSSATPSQHQTSLLGNDQACQTTALLSQCHVTITPREARYRRHFAPYHGRRSSAGS